jgi:hypothetical protein
METKIKFYVFLMMYKLMICDNVESLRRLLQR